MRGFERVLGEKKREKTDRKTERKLEVT